MNIIHESAPSGSSRLYVIKQTEVIVQPDTNCTPTRAKREAEKRSISLIVRELYGSDEKIEYDPFGKPHLTEKGDHISLSHSGPYYALLTHKQKPVGIDIQFPTEKLFRIRKKFLNPDELRFCGENIRRHLLCWSAKESIYKMHGRPGVSLRTAIDVLPFEEGNSGVINGKLRISGTVSDVDLAYFFIDEYALVHTL